MKGGDDTRQKRRKEILKELGLTPLWRRREHIPISAREGRGTMQVLEELAAPHGEPAENSFCHGIDPTDDRRTVILRMEWDELKASVAECTACRLCHSRKRTVFGVGDQHADWLYVGEGPGAQEDIMGEPFVGQAGKLLDNMLAGVDLKRGRNVFIANIVKCRPPGNREPHPDEAQSCEPYLARQIELIRPKLIIALGKVAAQNLLNTDASIGSLRGRLHRHAGIPVIVTYHPAYLLRTLVAKAKAWEDLCFAMSTMEALTKFPNLE
jgi:uracil-DNA glycosylase family 4